MLEDGPRDSSDLAVSGPWFLSRLLAPLLSTSAVIAATVDAAAAAAAAVAAAAAFSDDEGPAACMRQVERAYMHDERAIK